MDQQKILIAIIGMTIVTYLPRVLPAWFLTSHALPASLAAWLRFIPPAVMAAMLMPALMLENGHVSVAPGNVYLWSALPTLALAYCTRNFLGTVVTGSALVAIGRYFGSP